MALSEKTKRRVVVALAHADAGGEVIEALETAGGVTPAAAVADVTTADATDATDVVVLANANKAKINELLAALRDAGLLSA